MLAVCKRELRAYLHNLYGWLFAAVLLLTAGITVFLFNLLAGAADMIYALPELAYALILMVPVLCAGMMPKDKRDGLDELYAALPVSTARVVLGKYLAMLTVLALPTLVLCLYPLVLALYGTTNYAGAYASLLVFFLLGAAMMAVCLFLSSLTRRPWVAALVGWVVSAVLYGVPHLTVLLPMSAAGVADVLDYLSPFYHYDRLLSWQLFDLGAVVLLLSYVVVFLLLTVIACRASGRRVRPTALAKGVALAVGAACLLSVANVGMTYLPDRKDDISIMGVSRVSTETTLFLQSMKRDATVWWLCDRAEPIPVMDLLLDHYEGEHVTVKVLDLMDEDDPDVARLLKYHGELESGSVVIECAETDRSRAIAFADLYYYTNNYIDYIYADYLGEGESLEMSRSEMEYYIQLMANQGIELTAGSITYTHFNGEAMLTGALDYVTTEEMPVVYQLSGHGGGVDAAIAETLQFVDLDLSQAETVPVDASCVVICDPTTDLSDRETVLLKDYIAQGGSVILSTAAGCERMTNLMSVCALFGVSAEAGTVSDPESLSDSAQETESAGTIAPIGNTQSEIGSMVQQTMSSAFLLMHDAHSITICPKEELEDMGAGVYTLLSSTEGATLVTDDGELPLPEDKTGYVVGVSASLAAKDADGNYTTAYLTWFADDGLFTEEMVEKTQNSNLLYLAASVNATAESFVSSYGELPSVNMSVSAMSAIPTAAMVIWAFIILAMIPLGTLTVGAILHYKRRRNG